MMKFTVTVLLVLVSMSLPFSATGQFKLDQPDPSGSQSAAQLMSDHPFESLEHSQMWRFLESPIPGLNISISGSGTYAGDITGSGQTAFLFRAQNAIDERSDSPVSTPKTLVYFADNHTAEFDQVIYEYVYPVGDLTGDGYADGFARIDDQLVLFNGGPDGYEKTTTILPEITSNLSNYRTFGDLDGDGTEDVVFFSFSELTLLFGSNNGAPMDTTVFRFQPGESYSNWSNSNFLCLADVAGDGTDEIVFIDQDNNLYVLQINEEQEVSILHREEIEMEGNRQHMLRAATDVNGSGVVELIVQTGNTYSVIHWDENEERFDVDSPEEIHEGELHLAGDLDGDGYMDFVLRDPDSDEWYIAFGAESISELSDDYYVSTSETGELTLSDFGYVVDVTGNGEDDLVFSFDSDDGFGRLYLSVNEGRNVEYTIISFDREDFVGEHIPGVVPLGDISGNGADDVAFVHHSRGKEKLSIYYGGQNISQQPDVVIETPFRQVLSVASGDFNGDGETDIAISLSADLRVDYSNVDQVDDLVGVHFFWGGNITGNSLMDGDSDHFIPFKEVFYEERGDSFIHLNWNQYGFTSIASVGDFNGNGADDLVYSALMTNRTYVTFGGQSISSTPDFERNRHGDVHKIGDIDGNGQTNFAITELDNYLELYKYTDAFNFEEPDLILTQPDSLNDAFSYYYLMSGDFNGNGIHDIVTYQAINMSQTHSLHFMVYQGESLVDSLEHTPDRVFEVPEYMLSSNNILAGAMSNLPGYFEDGRDALFMATSAGFTNYAWIFDLGENGSDEPIVRLETPNQNENIGLGNNINLLSYHLKTAIGDFSGDGSLEAILTQERDNQDMAPSSRVYRFVLTEPEPELEPETFVSSTKEYLPSAYELSQNYPNPFNPTTVINYQLPVNSEVRLEVFDILGRRVALLVNGQVEAGYHNAEFNANNLASGMYIYRITASEFVKTRQMMLVK